MGNAWTAIEHRSRALSFYLPIHTGNVLLKFGFDIQSYLESRNWKIQYRHQAAILKVKSMKIKRLPIHTCDIPVQDLISKANLKSESKNHKYPIWLPGSPFENDIAENQQTSDHCHRQYPCNLKLKFQSKLELCSGNHVVYRRMDGQMDAQGESSIPPTDFFWGVVGVGYKSFNIIHISMA